MRTFQKTYPLSKAATALGITGSVLWNYVVRDELLPGPTIPTKTGRRRVYDEAGFADLAQRVAVLRAHGVIKTYKKGKR